MKNGRADFSLARRLGVSAGDPGAGGGDRLALVRLCREAGVRFASDCLEERPVLASGLAALDGASRGGLPRHGLAEVVEAGPSSGGTLLLHHLLERVRVEGGYAALVDGADGFAPDAAGAAGLRHLYWVRCRNGEEALRAADLLARDPNFLLLVLDLRRVGAEVLRRTPGRYWYRLQRALRGSRCCGLVLGTFPLVVAASPRLRVEGVFHLNDIEGGSREVLAARLAFEPLGAAGLRRQG